MATAAREPRDSASGADRSAAPGGRRPARRAARPLDHVSAVAVWQGGKLHVLDPSRYQRDVARLALGNGEEAEIRITPAAEAKRQAQVRLWFACIRELSDYTGYDVKEMHELSKAAVMEPDWDSSSLAAWTKDQLSAAITKLLQWAAEEVGCVLRPEAA